MSLANTLNKRVLIQAPAGGQDESGQPSTEWVDFFTDGDGKLWAGITDISGREFVSAGATQNSVTTKILIRHRAGIDASMRVLHGADVYKIEAVLGQDGRTLLLMCSRGTI